MLSTCLNAVAVTVPGVTGGEKAGHVPVRVEGPSGGGLWHRGFGVYYISSVTSAGILPQEGSLLLFCFQVVLALIWMGPWVVYKLTRPALERNEDNRFAYMAMIREQYPPETLVFLDESACNRFTTRRTYGWAPTGMRARRHDFFVRGTR